MSVRIRLQHHSAEGRRRPLACQAIAATLTPVEKLVGLTGALSDPRAAASPAGRSGSPYRSRKRFVLPDAVLGIASMNSITRGTL